MSVAERAATEKLYEGMFLLDSSKFAADPDAVTQHLIGILEKAGANIVAHRPWLDGRLAYEINNQRRGLHYLVYFRLAGTGITDIKRSCKLSDYVIRELILSHSQTLFDAMVAALEGAEEEEGEAETATAESKA